jgi:hypothetical protein
MTKHNTAHHITAQNVSTAQQKTVRHSMVEHGRNLTVAHCQQWEAKVSWNMREGRGCRTVQRNM